MTSDTVELLKVYRTNAVLHREATEAGNSRKANRAYEKIISAYKLLDQSEQGKTALKSLLADADDGVCVWAATHTLKHADGGALARLDAIAQGNGLISFNAQMVAKLWRAGELELP
ncbi:hypothetical protein [Neorhizobium sp. NCHU2750]|uniref:hypothetical protein n=1 Tax=Neorhizobium sp. NCHU2750 TaxID=1825976 RepID=UPI000EB6CD72|nr:hypothetical protein NCHU2750_30540 [Neorhizobium sp. NCHU2750]